MNPPNVQVQLFQYVKELLPPHLSLVDEIAALLHISNDSAYRRIRGEKNIDLQETHLLCSHFKISMDQLLGLQGNAFVFSGILRDQEPAAAFDQWMAEVEQQLKTIASFERKHIYFLMKDIPPFVHFHIPELIAFRCFLWRKSILQDEELKGVKFHFGEPKLEKYLTAGKRILDVYNRIPATEIWNIESINSTLNQIRFYAEAGVFRDEREIKILYEKVETLINHIEKQAEQGVKFAIGQTPGLDAAKYQMFVNELILGNNTLLAEVGSNRATFINHSVLYFIATTDKRFNDAMFTNLDNLMKKSTLISTVGEKERASFFNRLRQKIHESAALAIQD